MARAFAGATPGRGRLPCARMALMDGNLDSWGAWRACAGASQGDDARDVSEVRSRRRVRIRHNDVWLLPYVEFMPHAPEHDLTKPAAATQAQVKRNIRAALAAGCRVRGIAPDGTVLLADGEEPVSVEPPAPEPGEWDD